MTIFELKNRTVEILSPAEARHLLRRMNEGDEAFPPTRQGARQLKLLTDLSISDMGGKEHHGDAKRADRSWGQHIRKRRTGNRKG